MKSKLYTISAAAIQLCLFSMPLFSAPKCCGPAITQPIGDLIRVWEAEGPPPLALQPPSRIPPFTTPTTGVQEVNYINAQWVPAITPQTVPFDVNTSVTEIVLTKPQHFVRLYAPATGGTPNGAFIVRSQYVRGLTAEQIKNSLALPALPTHIVNVDLPASPNPDTGKDYALWTGIAAPIAGFGEGGGVQNRIITDTNGTHYFPNYQYALGVRDHPQPIGLYALSYAPMAGNGNTGQIAAYLDKFIPCAYSDLENVYTTLDYLNWVDFGPDPLQHALNQIGPQDYQAIPFVINRNSLLFANALLDRCRLLRCREIANDCCQLNDPNTAQVTIQGIGEYLNEGHRQHENGFNNWTGGLLGTFDYQVSSCLTTGVGISWMENQLKWHKNRGRARINTAKVGLYGTFCPDDLGLPENFYVDGAITGGYNWTRGHRHINFAEIHRSAKSNQTGYDFSCHLETGFDRSCWLWTVSPLARVSYFDAHQNRFKEHGANSLDLRVSRFYAQTVRTHLGADLSRSINCCGLEVVPRLGAFWVYDFFMDKRKIRSHLKSLDNHFTVHGFNRNRSGFVGSANLLILNTCGFTLEGNYDVEAAHKFLSQAFRLGLNYYF